MYPAAQKLNTTLFSMNKYLVGAYRVQNVHAIEITNFGLTEVRGYGGCFFEGGHQTRLFLSQ